MTAPADVGTASDQHRGWRNWAARALAATRRTSVTLGLLTVLSAVVSVIALVGFVVDDRIVLGVSTWSKSAKFAISFLLFAPTLIAIYSAVRMSRALRWSLEVLGAALILELVLIAFQSARGVASHHNDRTDLDRIIWTSMAVGIGIFTITAFIVGVILVRRRLASPAISLSVQLAIPLMTLGALLGYIMTAPSPAGPVGEGIGGHTVGAVDGGPGIPIMGWSTEFGDLRVMHFVGLHAAQVIPAFGLLIAFLVSRRIVDLTATAQRRIVIWAALGYAGLITTTALQAFANQSIVSTSGPFLAGYAVTTLVPMSVIGLELVIARARMRGRQ